MKAQLSLLTRVGGISPILALRALIPWVGEFSVDDALQTVHTGDCQQVLLDGSPVVTARVDNDDILIRVERGLPGDLEQVVRALGIRPEADAGYQRFDLEAMDDRLLTIDTAWVLLHRLGRTGVPDARCVDAAQRLLQFAANWRMVRDALFERETKALARREAELDGQARALVADPVHRLSAAQLHYDPRGSAVELTFTTGEGLYLCGCKFDWVVATATSSVSRYAPEGAGRRYGVKPTRLGSDVVGALNSAAIDGADVRIHQQLTPKLFAKVSDVLEALGGRWHVGRKAHAFKVDPMPLIDDVISTGCVFTARDYEFFATQAPEVKRALAALQLTPDDLVLEPSAGRGALAAAAAEVVGVDRVTCYELMPANVEDLREAGFEVGAPRDFLAVTPTPCFTAVVMNPPFSGGRDLAHVRHAMKFLKPGGRLVAIMSCRWQDSDSKDAVAFRAWIAHLGAGVQAIARGAFKAVGTDTPSCLVSLRAPCAPREADLGQKARTARPVAPMRPSVEAQASLF